MNIIDIKKDLYKSKEIAKFTHYDGNTGRLFYVVNIEGVPYQFYINVIEKRSVVKEFIEYFEEVKSNSQIRIEYEILQLSDDLKGASFNAEIKGSELIRWIDKAVKGEYLIKLSV